MKVLTKALTGTAIAMGLGLMTLTETGLDGAVLQMFSHGVIAGLLFAVVGRMVYERTHTRDLLALEKMRLSKEIPFAAVVFVIAGMASVGLPGFSGFIAELQVLLGAWRSYPLFVAGSGLGILVGIAYTWRAMQKAFFGDAGPRQLAMQGEHRLDPVTFPERVGAMLLLGCTVLIGLYPQLLMRLILPALNSPMFAGLRRGGWR